MGVTEPTRAAATADLRAVYRSTLSEVFGYLLLHTGGNRSLAEDLTADTYLHATEQFRRGRSADVTVAWLKTVAKRRLIDHWRREASLERRATRLRNEVLVSNRQVDDGFDRQAVYDALSKLDHEHRLVLLLKHLDGLSVNEIAGAIGRSPKATESLLGRARIAFRSVYAGERDD